MLFSRVAVLFLLLISLCVHAAPTGERSFRQVVASGELRMGVAIYPPWTMRAKDGDLIGSEVDIGRRLARDMNLKPTFGVYEFDQLIPALQRGEIDVVVAGLGITPARALLVNFSQPYGSFGIELAANTRLTREFASVTAMNNKDVTLGVVTGSSAADVARRMFPQAKITAFNSEEEVTRALLDDKLHGYVESSPVPGLLALRYPNRIDRPLATPLVTFRSAFAVRQGDPDLLAFLNAWIVAREADAWLQSTEDYWFGSLQWQQLVP